MFLNSSASLVLFSYARSHLIAGTSAATLYLLSLEKTLLRLHIALKRCVLTCLQSMSIWQFLDTWAQIRSPISRVMYFLAWVDWKSCMYNAIIACWGMLSYCCRFLDQNINIIIEADSFASLMSLQTLYEFEELFVIDSLYTGLWAVTIFKTYPASYFRTIPSLSIC
jgi:hypothetical protein